ncbi:LysM peptidoglycan-binding domain-containing protein [Planktotalea sp.]|uniref:LysM peptidoglycan-binding domain-containing protein n=1 Tax=Planktotalea sp. TaxID=2029877 RepID=UPI003D6B224B
MIRVMAFMGVFLLSIIGLLLLQPGERQASMRANETEVSRNTSETMLTTRVTNPEPVLEARPEAGQQLAALQKLQKATDASLAQKAMKPAKGDMRALTSNVLANLRAKSTNSAEQGSVHLASLVSRSMGAAGDDAFLSAISREAKYGTEEYAKLAMVGAARNTDDVKTRWIENARKQSKAMGDATTFMSSGTKKTPGFDDTVHIVKRGDSLMKLSIRYYGTTIDYQLIYEANRDSLPSPDRIRVGQKLKIPPMTNV